MEGKTRTGEALAAVARQHSRQWRLSRRDSAVLQLQLQLLSCHASLSIAATATGCRLTTSALSYDSIAVMAAAIAAIAAAEQPWQC